MSDKFIVRHKSIEVKEDTKEVISLRLEGELRESYDMLAGRTNRSRNEVMCMALEYALFHLQEE